MKKHATATNRQKRHSLAVPYPSYHSTLVGRTSLLRAHTNRRASAERFQQPAHLREGLLPKTFAQQAAEQIDSETVPRGGAFEGDLNPFQARANPYYEYYTQDEDVSLKDLDYVPPDDSEQDQAQIEMGESYQKEEPPRYPRPPAGDQEEPQEGGEPNKQQQHPPRSLLRFCECIESFKYLYSMGLLIFSVTIIMTAIFTKQTVVTSQDGLHPAIAFVVFWFLIFWLAMMEGGQGCLVGLQPIEKALYAESHRTTLQNTALAHEGDNMERFIVGRQFLVVLVVFVTNMIATCIEDASVLRLGDGATEVFLNSGVAVILITIMLGQLTAQVNAAHCMLDFVNNYFMLFTTYLSLALEASGILHSVYLVQIIFSKLTNAPIQSNEAPRTAAAYAFFWVRVAVSLVILALAFSVTLSALFQGKTTMYEGVPEAVSVIIFFTLMCFVGTMEGMQIALFAVVNMPMEELEKYPMAAKICALTFTGNNLQAFLIGRQVCVTICMFVVARITSINVDIYDPDSENIFGVGNALQTFFNTGLLGAVITTIVASLAWRIIASSFPVSFLSNPLIYLIIRLCLLLEASGVCSAAWLSARLHKQLVGYQLDEEYIGTREERALAKQLADDATTEDF